MNQSIQDQKNQWSEAERIYEHSKLDPKKKYLSDFQLYHDWRKEGQLALYSNKKKIISIIYELIKQNKSAFEFIYSLKEYKPIIRDGVIHNPLCEYAIGNSCNCPCNEKYHGMKGANL